MRILFCGDVVGRSGRNVIKKYIPELKQDMGIDFVIVNAENSAGGFGLTRKISEIFFKVGVDVLTTGDHAFDQKGSDILLSSDSRVLRPANMPSFLPGVGYGVFEDSLSRKILIIQVLGQVFINFNADCPFRAVDEILKNYKIGVDVAAIVVDFHSEATSEANAMGHFLDGRVSLVCGSHTHVPTADAHIMQKGTAYQTDTGMCGDYNSVIGFDKKNSVSEFVHKVRESGLVTANGEGTLCGVLVDIDDENGLANNISLISRGGVLNRL